MFILTNHALSDESWNFSDCHRIRLGLYPYFWGTEQRSEKTSGAFTILELWTSERSPTSALVKWGKDKIWSSVPKSEFWARKMWDSENSFVSRAKNHVSLFSHLKDQNFESDYYQFSLETQWIIEVQPRKIFSIYVHLLSRAYYIVLIGRSTITCPSCLQRRLQNYLIDSSPPRLMYPASANMGRTAENKLFVLASSVSAVSI